MTAGGEGAGTDGADDHCVAPAMPWDRVAWVAIVIGTLARGLVLILHPPLDYVYSDMAGYVVGAQHLVTGGPQSRLEAFFPSGTHLVLAIPLLAFGSGRSGLWAASILWFVLGSVSPWLAWRWARRILPVPAAALAGIGCALWPLFVTQVGFFMSELPAITFLLASLLVASRIRDGASRALTAELLLLGVLVGLGITVRPQLLLNDVLAIVPVVWLLRRRLPALGALAIATVLPIGLIVAINSDAAGRFTLLSENTGVNFFLAQCNAGSVVAYGPHSTYEIETPVYTQTHNGRSYLFEGHDIWDQRFFFGQAGDCIRAEGVGQVGLVARHVLDLTVTSVPWPQYDDPGMRGVVRAVNRAYGLALPTIIVASFIVFWRRRPANRAPRLVLAHLLCVLPTVVVFLSEPRFRVPYDVFGLTLVAALLSRLLGLEHQSPPGVSPREGSVHDVDPPGSRYRFRATNR